MRALLERSRSARIAVVAAASLAVLPLAGAASAEDAFGFHLETLWPALSGAPTPAAAPPPAAPAAAPAHHHHARRIWAAARSRPLRITLARRRHAPQVAEAHRRAPVRAARLAASPEPQVVFPKLIVLPKPPRPALVTIYQDKTLRSGDAVMMADGIHVFREAGAWPHRPRDFVRLTLVSSLGWQLRQTLDALDKNPPTRWSSAGSTAG